MEKGGCLINWMLRGLLVLCICLFWTGEGNAAVFFGALWVMALFGQYLAGRDKAYNTLNELQSNE